MKRTHHDPNESLELLLDTICNMFGSIIFVALIAIASTVKICIILRAHGGGVATRRVEKRVTNVADSGVLTLAHVVSGSQRLQKTSKIGNESFRTVPGRLARSVQSRRPHQGTSRRKADLIRTWWKTWAELSQPPRQASARAATWRALSQRQRCALPY